MTDKLSRRSFVRLATGAAALIQVPVPALSDTSAPTIISDGVFDLDRLENSAASFNWGYETRSLAESGDVPAPVTTIRVGDLLYKSDPSGKALTTNNGNRKWSPLDVKTVKHYGAVGDGDASGNGTDDTNPVQTAINDLQQGETLVFQSNLNGRRTHYNVTSLVIDSVSNIYASVRFEFGVRLYGNATTPVPAVLDIRGQNKFEWHNLYIISDGAEDNPAFATNYTSAIRMFPQLVANGYGADRPCQLVTFWGGYINGFRKGLIIGNDQGEVPEGDTPMSENRAFGMTFYGVERPLIMNANRGYMSFTDCLFIAQKFGNGSWWDNNTGFVIRADEGTVVVNGGEMQRAIAPGYSLYAGGGEIFVRGGCVFETAAQNFIGVGDTRMEILDPANGYVSPQIHSRFKFEADATGTLILRGQFEKENHTTSLKDGLLVDASEAPSAKYTLDVRLRGWQWDSDSPLVIGGIADIRRIMMETATVDEPTLLLEPNGDSWDWNVATDNGDNMSTTLDALAKGGWSQAGGAGTLAFGKYTADVPSGSASAIRFQQSGGQVFLGTPTGTGGMLLRGHETVLYVKVKEITATTFFELQMQFFDGAGAGLGDASSIFTANVTSISSYGMNANYQQLVLPLNAPDDARFARVLVTGNSRGDPVDIAFTDLRIV